LIAVDVNIRDVRGVPAIRPDFHNVKREALLHGSSAAINAVEMFFPSRGASSTAKESAASRPHSVDKQDRRQPTHRTIGSIRAVSRLDITLLLGLCSTPSPFDSLYWGSVVVTLAGAACMVYGVVLLAAWHIEALLPDHRVNVWFD
jgi:hypothetical protein